MSDEQTGPEVEKESPKARKRKIRENVEDGRVLRLSWNLHELPSSQHRAGLAGLALCVQFLERKPDRKGTCSIECIDENGLTLAVDRDGMQSLFDDVYDASLEEQERRTKLKKGKGDQKQDISPKRAEEREVVDPKTNKTKTVQLFIYDQVVPRGSLIDELDTGSDGNSGGIWFGRPCEPSPQPVNRMMRVPSRGPYLMASTRGKRWPTLRREVLNCP